MSASIALPGRNDVWGLWPAFWTMGVSKSIIVRKYPLNDILFQNLGRAAYGASLEGLWPYSYDSCDVGTVANQTWHGMPEKVANQEVGSKWDDGYLSFLPGQRLSRCTCPGEIHPGPIDHKTGEFVGRAAPEIDGMFL